MDLNGLKEKLINKKNIIDILKILSEDKTNEDILFSLFTDDNDLKNININCIMKNKNISDLNMYDNDTKQTHTSFNINNENFELGGKNNQNDQPTCENDVNNEINKETNEFVSKYKIVRTKKEPRKTKRFTKSKRK